MDAVQKIPSVGRFRPDGVRWDDNDKSAASYQPERIGHPYVSTILNQHEAQKQSMSGWTKS